MSLTHPDDRQLALFKSAGMETRVDRETGDIMIRIGQNGWQRGIDVLKAARGKT